MVINFSIRWVSESYLLYNFFHWKNLIDIHLKANKNLVFIDTSLKLEPRFHLDLDVLS